MNGPPTAQAEASPANGANRPGEMRKRPGRRERAALRCRAALELVVTGRGGERVQDATLVPALAHVGTGNVLTLNFSGGTK